LPIQVFYNGKDDLSPELIQKLLQRNVSVIDASTLISPLKKNALSGWAIKPFVMLMTSFQEYLFLDADVLFLQNPQKLFQNQQYRYTGTLYFRDRTIASQNNEPLNYFKSLVDNPSEYAKNERLWRNLSVHSCDSGVIVMNKKRGGMFVLLLATILNMDPYKNEMYRVIHGDKESYWISNEALNVPYSWGFGAGGAIGYPNPNLSDSICGPLYHVDENWEPLWFNGGITMNKRSNFGSEILINITHYAVDSTFENVTW
jgi:hypothetical protein